MKKQRVITAPVEPVVKRLYNHLRRLGVIDPTKRTRCKFCKGPKHWGVCSYPTNWFKGTPFDKIGTRMNER